MPARSTPRHYPYMLRGRVEVAIFNCPYCNTILKFRGITVYKKRCPRCQTTLYVFLRVCVSRAGWTSPPKGTQYGTETRPVDTILPVVLTPASTDTPTPTLDSYNARRAALNAAILPLEGDPLSLMASSTRKLYTNAGHQPAGPEVDQFIAELGELGIDNSIESLPSIGMGKWQVGELAHRLVDLDELRERGESVRPEKVEDSEPEYPE